ncbi:MAG: M20/M25/M40 family metallo-hydrolase, partial [Oscillospiraceae bacterium]
PVVLMAHYDVVSASGGEWASPPFAAEIREGAVWARGAVDTKCILAAVLEAFTHLLQAGFAPEGDIYFASTNNEETGGDTTPKMVEWFRERGIAPRLVLDEGGAVVSNLPLGVQKPFAMVGVGEKGIADVLLTAHGAGGHSSTPCAQNAPARLVRALHRIETRPAKAALPPELREMLTALAAHASFGYRLVFANLWLFAPLVKRVLAAGPETNAMVRTTSALTQLAGSDTINTLPKTATAGFSVRVAAGDSVNAAVQRLKKAAGGEGLEFTVAHRVEPPPVSGFSTPEFKLIAAVAQSVYPEAGVAPYVMNGGTDSKHFSEICGNVYRFGGFALTTAERQSIHAANERLPLGSYYKGIAFYIQLIRALNTL